MAIALNILEANTKSLILHSQNLLYTISRYGSALITSIQLWIGLDFGTNYESISYYLFSYIV